MFWPKWDCLFKLEMNQASKIEYGPATKNQDRSAPSSSSSVHFPVFSSADIVLGFSLAAKAFTVLAESVLAWALSEDVSIG